MGKITSGVKRNMPSILAFIGALGVIGTAVLTGRATVAAVKLLDDAKEAKGEPLTLFETVSIAGPAYIPAVVTGAASIGCIVGSNRLHKERNAALLSTSLMLSEIHKDYKDKVIELYGAEADERIERARTGAGDETLTFYEPISNRYFERTMAEIIDAEYHFNRNFSLRSYAELNEFYDFLGLDRTEYGSKAGWSLEAGEVYYGYTWVDFYHERREGPDGLVYYSIEMPFIPTEDYLSIFDMEYDEAIHSLKPRDEQAV